METARINLLLSGAAGYYTDENMTVKTPEINMDTKTIYISDNAPIGSLVVLYGQPDPESASGVTLLESNTRRGYFIYEVTGGSSGGSND